MKVLAALLLLAGSTHGQQHAIRGTVTNCSGKHTIHIALFNNDGFFTGRSKALQTQKFAPAKVKDGKVAYEFRVAPGDYSVGAFEDKNEDGKLDVGALGPSEPQQLYRKFTAWRTPRFEDVKFRVSSDVNNANIELN